MDNRKKKKRVAEPTWEEKKAIADEEEKSLLNQIRDLQTWIGMVDGMNDAELMEYLMNRPKELKSVKIQKRKQSEGT
ncbi:hypothetical protein LINGRAHAP2_LOCUS36356 [Linum grandiflorum]